MKTLIQISKKFSEFKIKQEDIYMQTHQDQTVYRRGILKGAREKQLMRYTHTLGSRERDLSYMGQGSRYGGKAWRGEEGVKEGVRVCHVHAPALHKACKHYEL